MQAHCALFEASLDAIRAGAERVLDKTAEKERELENLLTDTTAAGVQKREKAAKYVAFNKEWARQQGEVTDRVARSTAQAAALPVLASASHTRAEMASRIEEMGTLLERTFDLAHVPVS